MTLEDILADETSQTILEVAQKVFLEKGYHAVEMKDIAQRAGIARSTLYRHFPSKDELAFYLSLYVLNCQHLFYDGPLHGATGWENTREMAIETVHHLAQHRSQVAYLAEFDLHFSGNYPGIPASSYYVEFLHSKEQPFARLIQQGLKDGSIRPLEDPGLTACTLVNALLAMAQRVLLREEHLRQEQGYGIEMIYYLIEQIMNSIKA